METKGTRRETQALKRRRTTKERKVIIKKKRKWSSERLRNT